MDRHEAARASGLAAGSMDLLGLHRAIMARMSEVAASLAPFETKTEARAPRVFDGWLPPKASSDEERFPFLIVRLKSGSDSAAGADENATVAVKIIVGLYSDTDQGFFDALSVIDAVRADLGAEPEIEGTGYQHVGPLTWEIPEEQPRPEWFGTITTNWQVPRPQRVEARNASEG